MTINCKNLDDWLLYCEQLHPSTIDMGLDRVKSVAEKMNLSISVPVITVAGTNGKGSSCALLEAILSEAGYRVGLYTSPHLVNFEERLRIGRQAVDAQKLVEAFECVELARTKGQSPISLTYFEFSTLAILSVMQDSELDVAVLEVGLGGRLDAVNIIDSDCALITSVDIDHTSFLGLTRELIGREKAGIMRSGKPIILSDPVPPKSILDYAEDLGADIWRFGVDFNFSGDKQQWSWVGRGRRYSGLAYPALRGANQLINASGVLGVLTAIRDILPVTAQAVRNGLAFVELPGRFQIIPGEPQMVLDVAHNPHAVAALAANLDAMGYFPATHAVLGLMSDKDVKTILLKMSPLVTHWYFTDLPTSRAFKAKELLILWSETHLAPDVVSKIFVDPKSALQAALDFADPADRIVVFGSFLTVGGILKDGLPRRLSKHLPIH